MESYSGAIGAAFGVGTASTRTPAVLNLRPYTGPGEGVDQYNEYLTGAQGAIRRHIGGQPLAEGMTVTPGKNGSYDVQLPGGEVGTGRRAIRWGPTIVTVQPSGNLTISSTGLHLQSGSLVEGFQRFTRNGNTGLTQFRDLYVPGQPS